MTPNPDHPATRKYALVMMWLLVLLVLVVGFSWLEQRRARPNQNLVTHQGDGYAEVVLEQGEGDHYWVDGEINGAKVGFLLDTGATAVAIPSGLARQLGLKRLAEVSVNTANGVAQGYLTRLDSVRIGTIEVRDVRAIISPGLDGEVLLGMNFLGELELVQRDRTLILRQY